MIKKFLLLFSSILFLFSCNKNGNTDFLDVKKDRELLGEYFSAATVGVISAGDRLKYILHEPIEIVPGADQLEEFISISPAVKGKLTMTGQMVVEFTPEGLLEPGQVYEIQLNPSVLDSKKYSKKISYKVKTMQQGMDIHQTAMMLEEDGSWVAEFGITLADEVDMEKLTSCFSVDGGQIHLEKAAEWRYTLSVHFAKGKPVAPLRYSSEAIGVPDSGEINSEGPATVTAGQLGVVFSYHQAEEKVFHIYFSEKIQPNTDLTGLITVNNNSVPTSIEGNRISLFLAETGDVPSLEVVVSAGIPSVSGAVFPAEKVWTLSPQANLPAAEFVSDGHYFPSKGQFHIPVKTRSLRNVRLLVVEIKPENVLQFLSWQSLTYTDFYTVRLFGNPVFDEVVHLQPGTPDAEGWVVHGIDLSEKIARNPGSMYHISMDFGPEHTDLICTKELFGNDFQTRLPGKDFFALQEEYYNDYYYSYVGYDWREGNDPCKVAYYVNRQPAQRMFICSDFSVVAKKAGMDYHFAIADLMDLTPSKNVVIDLYSMQAQKLASCTTTGEGFAVATGLPAEAALARISSDDKITYLRLNPNESNPLTEFAIDGDRSDAEMEWYLYTERAVWRPGDSIHMYAMSNGNMPHLPAGLPLTLSFYNPDRLLVDRQVVTYLPGRQLVAFRLKTAPDAKTGLYRCEFSAGPRKLTKQLRIETFKPNSSEIEWQFDAIAEKTIYSNTIKGVMTSRYLTGFPLAGAMVRATARVRKQGKPFPLYATYTFDVLDQAKPEPSILLFEGKTDGSGRASFSSDVSMQSWNTPVNVSVEALTTLPGGGTAQEGRMITVSPFKRYLGAKKKEGSGWSGNYLFNENVVVDLVSLRNDGKVNPVKVNATYAIHQHIESWWVDKYRLASDGNFVDAKFWKYVSEGSTSFVKNGKISLPARSLGKGAFKLTVKDLDSGHLTQVYFTVYDEMDNIPGSQPYIVEFATDKETYHPGEDIQLQLPAIGGAKAFISVERGQAILHQQWVTLQDEPTKALVKAEDSWAPNAYIHLTVMQPYQQTNNDLPLRMYGIRPVEIKQTAAPLQPVVSVPQRIESGTTVQFDVQEKSGLPMEYSLALVDEGILGLTGFSTPDPARHFYGNLPLLVKTWDIYMYLMNYFKGKIAGIISVGGDNAFHPDALPELSRFSSLSKHLGPFRLNKGDKRTHNMTIPNFIGKARVMVVACNKDKFGHFEQSVQVRKDLMLKTQFPRTLYVTDKFSLPVTVFRENSQIQSATLKANVTNGFVQGLSPSKTISFGKENQAMAFYDLTVLNRPGKATFQLEVNANGKSMKEQAEILIRYPNEVATETRHIVIEPGKEVSFPNNVKGYPNAYSAPAVASGIPLPDLVRYGKELIEYPYGCLEQITSAGLSQLYLSRFVTVSGEDEEKRKKNLAESVSKIARLQTASGRFSYWENNEYHAWSDIYAGLFLTELQKDGLLQSNGAMLEKWISAHESIADRWAVSEASTQDVYNSESLIQAFRLYTLASASRLQGSAINRFLSANKSTHPLTWWLMAGVADKGGFPDITNNLISKAESLMSGYDAAASYATFGSKARDLAIIVKVLSGIPKTRQKSDMYYEEMVNELNQSSWVNTQEKGFAMLAVHAYWGSVSNKGQNVQYVVKGNGQGEKQFSHSAFVPQFLNIQAGKTITIQNKGKNRMYLVRTERYISDDLSFPASSEGILLQTDYTNTSQRKAGLGNVRLGDEILMTIRLTNTTPLDQQSLALAVRTPAGLELINERISDGDIGTGSAGDIYQDFKDDVVHSFFGLKSGKQKTLTFRFRAAFTGDFHLPGASCTHMYKGGIFARAANGRIRIQDAR